MDSEFRMRAIRSLARTAVLTALAHDGEDAAQQDIDAIDYHLAQLADELASERTAVATYRDLLIEARARVERRLETDLGGVTRVDLSPEFDPRGFFVYCLWGEDARQPLYVGESTNIMSRLGSHLNESRKRQHVVRISLVRCASVRLMHETEARLIRRYQPPWNVIGVVACR